MAADPARQAAIVAAKKALGQADDRPRVTVNNPPPGRLQPLVDSQGNIVATFHNVTGEVTPIKGQTPGQPTEVGGTEVRKSPVPAQERKDIAGLEQALEGVGELRTLMKMPAVRDTIGPVAGRVTGATRGVFGAAPEVQELFRTSDRLAEFLLRALSGAQINESEYTRLRNLIPNPRTHISQFETDLNLFEREIQGTLSRRGGDVSAEPAQPAAGGGTFRVVGVKP
jgi:hypothetical protein